MPHNGIMQRFKGKIAAAALFLGGVYQYGPGSRVAYSTAGTQTLGAEGIASINASSGISIFSMADLPSAGQTKVFDLTVSSGVFIKAAAGASFDASTNTVIKSTYSQRITLRGLSTAKWTIVDVYPDSTAGGAPVGGVTLSTTT